MKWIAIAVAALGFVYVVVLAVLSAVSRKAPELGLVDGRLRPCRTRTNCISTEDTARGNPEAPFEYTGDAETALDRLASAIALLPRARVVSRRPGYLRAEFRTPVFRFVDDLEAAVDPAGGKLQIRSASRVGRGDHGVNRARVRELRGLFNQPK